MIFRTVPWVWVWCHLWTCFQILVEGSHSSYSILYGCASHGKVLGLWKRRGVARETLKAPLRFCVLSLASTMLHIHQWLQLMGTRSC